MIKQFFNNTAIVATYRRNYSPPQDIFCSNFLKERRTNLSRVYSEVLGQRSKIVNFRNALSRDSSVFVGFLDTKETDLHDFIFKDFRK